MKIDIIVVYVPRYSKGHEKNFVPPITGIHLAAITPAEHEVRVIHQQTEPVDYDTDADLIGLSFFTGFAAEAYRIADRFRALGKTVVAGGPHATFCSGEVLQHCDSVVTGEAESVWPALLEDYGAGRLKRIYKGTPAPIEGLPRPKYNLLPKTFFVPKVIQATRGCKFKCSFCTVPSLNPGFRVRPVNKVMADVNYDRFAHWWQRKIVWFWDDNPTADKAYFKSLLRKMIPLKKWWLTQASIDIVKDNELLDLMEASGCIGIFLGIETFGKDSLNEVSKRQNKVHGYRKAIEILHSRGICVMGGFVAGFDHDTPEDILQMAGRLYDIGIDVPYLSILTPYPGTPLYDRLKSQGRILTDCGWDFYNGYNVAFRPARMTPDELKQAHEKLWKRAFSPSQSMKRALRSFKYLRSGALMMCLMMNGFYGLKGARGNLPRDMNQLSAVAEKDYIETKLKELAPAPGAAI